MSDVYIATDALWYHIRHSDQPVLITFAGKTYKVLGIHGNANFEIERVLSEPPEVYIHTPAGSDSTIKRIFGRKW